ncbi:alpha-amylase family glycosyl hydrolase [Allopontixanthobacter sp.]|uniref:alpha-amylase family glycosyl hydrolase n=1 Tax=Allopontixanthobacter sp. TaxID=2906452 RepID=UPI002ABA1923|nr:alpha-amylase family glycosyl hydrolase [Allopontixanthobacter sp.]MDZ4306928.1 alpha-amylase family glycosyl hydrolase [Allopontixanthobacter sp.]
MIRFAAIAAALLALPSASCAQDHRSLTSTKPQTAESSFRDRLPEDEVIYFVLPDRFANGDNSNDLGGYPADRLTSGFDPEHKGFYHGGDLAGLTQKLDYIQGMGVTAVWFAPIFKNKPVQGPKGDESAGYHGYWVTDFTQVDPHFGTNPEFKAFVDAAHARGMKVYMDIITNHTADVIRYREGDAAQYAYRSLAEYPYSTRGDVNGPPINPGFLGHEVDTPENWAKLTDPAYAYTPYVPESEEQVKVPAWLNDPAYYHNRGDTFWVGESAVQGDFVGLDDLFTEHPRVMAGMIDIYGNWIDRFGIDGFRIDTAKHVNPEFWDAFVPAMIQRAAAAGIPNFHIFGEVATHGVDAALLARWTRISALPTNLDMAFAAAAQGIVSGTMPPAAMARMLEDDPLYQGGAATALRLPTFLGNHDSGRLSMFIKQANPDADDEELLQRVMLGNALLMGLRGVPVIYYGDEQGFVSDGNDKLAREDMLQSRVAAYNDNDLIGSDATTAQDNFDTSHPLYQQIAALAELRSDNRALRYGETAIRGYDTEPGLLAITRHDPASGQRVLLAFNSSAASITRAVAIDYATQAITPLAGQCPAAIAAPGAAVITLPPFGYAICELTGTAGD